MMRETALYRYGKVVLVTGASSGIGRAVAQALKEWGFHVYGTGRKAADAPVDSGKDGGFLKMLSMDVLKEETIQQAIDAIVRCEGELNILIHCAGMGIAGALEDVKPQHARLQMDTNLMGCVDVLRHVLPVMRKQKKGLCMLMGSVAGFFGIPFQSLYSASKFALKGLNEALRLECAPFGIRCCLIEPGDTKSGFTQARLFSGTNQDSAYAQAFARAVYAMEQSELKGKDADSVVKVVLRVLRRKRPPVCVTVGFSYKLLRFLKRLVSDRFVERMLKMMYIQAPMPPQEWMRSHME
jgi:NAD(P)-dependent dehydrogenase (short-subunit alcohol dehydrogenase family)